jgi:hypothetical protein
VICQVLDLKCHQPHEKSVAQLWKSDRPILAAFNLITAVNGHQCAPFERSPNHRATTPM